MTTNCTHPLCEIIGGACSIVVTRSRGCRPNVTAKDVAPEVIDEVRRLVAAIDDRAAAVRLAQIVRRETLDDRNLVAIAKTDELDFADALARLVGR